MVTSVGTRVAGTALSKALGQMLGATTQAIGGTAGNVVRGVGKEVVEEGIGQAAKNVFAGNVKGLTAAQLAKSPVIPELASKGLTAGSLGAIQTAGKVAEVGAPLGAAMFVGSMFDQQNVGSQPFRGRKSGNAEFDSFLHQQALEQQRLENEMTVIRQKAILGVPSPLQMAQAEKLITEAGEATNREALGVARSIYGTGLRA